MGKKFNKSRKKVNLIAEDKITPKVSVVVPVYNVDKDLERCIKCLIGQSLRKIEIIFVDDASTDSSVEIIDSYAKKDNRIKLIRHENNLSASISRKDGAMAANGEYTLFVDPDDSLKKNALEVAYLTAKEKNVEILHFGTNVINNGVTDKQIEWYNNFSKPYLGSIYGEEVFRKCFETQDYRFNIWNKLILTSLCKKAMSVHTDVPLPKAQDLYAYFLIAYFAKSYYGIEDKLYNYSFGGGISGGRTFTEEKFKRHCTHANVAYFIIDFLIKQNDLKKYYVAAFRIINNLINDNVASIKACGKAKVTFSAEQIFNEYWITGKYMQNMINFVEDNNNPVCAQLLFEINFKIFKNLSVKSRGAVLANLLRMEGRYPNNIAELLTKLDIQSKDYMFMQTIYSAKKSGIYGENYIPIFFAANENYMPYLGVTINSIIKSSNNNFIYDIYILHSGINKYYISKIVQLNSDNIFIHCLNVNDLIKSQKLYTNRHYSVEMYYRFLIPELFFFIQKVLYLDCDLLVLDSVHKLFMIDMEGCTLCAARNILHNEMYNYVVDKLQANPKRYFNSGVLLIDCKLFLKNGIKNKCYNFLNRNLDLACPDQDALNVCCDLVKLLPLEWNFQWHHLLNTSKLDKYQLVPPDSLLYEEALKKIKIVHYTSDKKPWNYLMSEYSDLYWDYVKSSIFSLEVYFKYRGLHDSLVLRVQELTKQINSFKNLYNLEDHKDRKKTKNKACSNKFLSKFGHYLYENGILNTLRRIFFGRNWANRKK